MNYKNYFFTLSLILSVGFLSFNLTYAYFSNSATSTNNIFAAASVFPTPTGEQTPPPSGSPSPTPDPFADAVASLTGTFGHCCSDLSSDPSVAQPLVTGAPDSPPDSDFIQISNNTVIVLQFVDNKAVDGPGADVRVHNYDTLFPALAKFELSADGVNFYEASDSSEDTADVDLQIPAPLTEAKYIRITDLVTEGEDFPELGFDIDATEAINNAAP